MADQLQLNMLTQVLIGFLFLENYSTFNFIYCHHCCHSATLVPPVIAIAVATAANKHNIP